MRRGRLIVAATTVLVLGACGGTEPASGDPALADAEPVAVVAPATQEKASGEVTIITTFDPGNPTVLDVAFDTHSVDLSFDVAAYSILTIDGSSVPVGNWDGTEPGGHHRWGTLAFTTEPTSGQILKYTFTGLPERLTFAWTVP